MPASPTAFITAPSPSFNSPPVPLRYRNPTAAPAHTCPPPRRAAAAAAAMSAPQPNGNGVAHHLQNGDPTAAAAAAAPPSASSLLAFYRLVGQLKTSKRRGWELKGLPMPESIADHMYRMSLIALTLPPPHDAPTPSTATSSSASAALATRDHLIKLALAHDVAEALVGDITPADNVAPDEKHRRERAAMETIRDHTLAGAPVGHELFALWLEYDAAETPAARIVKQIDKLELLVQADEYEKAHPATDLSEFFHRAQTDPNLFVHPTLRQIADDLLAERAKRRAAQ